MNKNIGLGIGALIIVLVVAFSGCTSTPAKETVIKEFNVSSLESMSVFGSKGIIFDIPDNVTKVRVVYNLTGANSYGMGSNGNMGVSSDNIDPNSGQSPIGFDNQYLEAGPGKTISGEQNFTSHGGFYYGGSFVKGKITVYGTE
ncbi:hypothetical protein [Methanobacterium spitsbergense]|uniref:Lipoprotein n=1 Tax=Methanobacterium spitsbergense TaxID=2874285 RepID=A0A8T5UYE7_9EURY|nr:hypothetical protein [Methanobacterium spitsbergense]MBZ2164601.1 hypothetical protein [Methanobacterium spitsbergense]